MAGPHPLWLCLYFHDLPLDQLRSNDGPTAVAEKQRIAFANEAAREAGVYPDMRLATAYALEPDIRIHERKPEREIRTLGELTEWGYQFTPTVMSCKDFCVLLEIGGSLILFKGLSRLLEEVERDLRTRGFNYCSGLAHTTEAAWLFAHYRADHDVPLASRELGEFVAPDPQFWLRQLSPLSLDYLDLSSRKKQQLFNMGLRTLKDVLALPRRELGKRFGRELLDLLTAIAGEGPEVTSDFQPARHFSEQVDFSNGITKISELDQPLEELLSRLLRFLHQQQLYIQQLVWRLYYYNQPGDKLEVHTSAANNNLASLLSLSKIKLEQITLKAPLESLVLNADVFTEATATSGELFPELSHPSNQVRDYRKLLDKLVTRLGDESLATVSVGDEHLPEYQQVVDPLHHQRIEELRFTEAPLPPDSGQWHLPLWLNREAVPVGAPGETPSPLRLIYGPQRMDSHWWKDRCQRDYFIARHKNGSYCWVFQDLKTQRWFLQGFYG